MFFTAAVAAAQSGAPGHVNAVGVVAAPGVSAAALRSRLEQRLGAGSARDGAPQTGATGRSGGGAGATPSRVEVLDRDHAANADAGDPSASDRATLVSIFGTMGGIAGAVALFVVAGTFALAIAQRRRETAVLRALGATPRQVRRLIATEAFLLSVVASGLGLLAGGPLARAIVSVLADHGVVPAGFEPGHSWIPLVAALGMGIGVAQVAVVAAARRAGRVRPAEALREVAVEHGRPGAVRTLAGVLSLGGGAAMALLFDGEQAYAFSILAAILLATGTALLGRWLLGLPAALLSRPLRLLGAPGLLASTGLAANRWRSAALATPILLIAMLVGSQGVLTTSSRHDTESVTGARVKAAHVVAGRDGAPLPAGTAAQLARLPGVDAATGVRPTQVFLLGKGLTGWDAPWPAAGLGRTGARRRTWASAPGASARFRAPPSRSAAWSRPKATSWSATPSARASRTRPRSRSASPRSTTAPRASAMSCSIRRSPASTEPRPRARSSWPAAGGRSTATPRPTPACGSRRAPSTSATCARSA